MYLLSLKQNELTIQTSMKRILKKKKPSTTMLEEQLTTTQGEESSWVVNETIFFPKIAWLHGW